MKYTKVISAHNDMDRPVLMYYECDQARKINRVMEMFPNGRFGLSSERLKLEYGGTSLQEGDMLDVDEINLEENLTAYEISATEFDEIWDCLYPRIDA